MNRRKPDTTVTPYDSTFTQFKQAELIYGTGSQDSTDTRGHWGTTGDRFSIQVLDIRVCSLSENSKPYNYALFMS